MKIRAVRYGSIMRQRGASNDIKCWDELDVVEIDLDDMFDHCNLSQKKQLELQQYFRTVLREIK